MKFTENEVLRFVQENDVKFIRLAFCDIFGNQKNISIMPRELARAFEYGIPFQANLIEGFICKNETELLLVPDPTTMAILPWRPQTGRVVRFFCNIKHLNGDFFDCDARYFLRRTAERLEESNLECYIGTECEFYLFQTDEEGQATTIPHDFAGYFDIAPKDKAENVRREICLSLEQMGISPESSHHERGPGQNEIVYKYSEPVPAADDLITYKSVVKTIANKNGLYASFMPKPISDQTGNQLILKVYLSRNGENIFCKQSISESGEAESFAAGIGNYLKEFSAFLLTSTNSYRRLAKEDPNKTIDEFESPIQILSDDTDRSGLVLNITDTCSNPYLLFGLLINAGLDGIEKKMKLSEIKIEFPDNLSDAIELAETGTMLRSLLPENLLVEYLRKKHRECRTILDAQEKDSAEQYLYFDQY